MTSPVNGLFFRSRELFVEEALHNVEADCAAVDRDAVNVQRRRSGDSAPLPFACVLLNAFRELTRVEAGVELLLVEAESSCLGAQLAPLGRPSPARPPATSIDGKNGLRRGRRRWR